MKTHSSTPLPKSVNSSISLDLRVSPTQCKSDTQCCTKLTRNFSSTFRQRLAAFPLCNRSNSMQRNNEAWMMFCRSPVTLCKALIVCCVIAHIHQNSLADVMPLALQLAAGPVSCKILLPSVAKYCSHLQLNAASVGCKILLPLVEKYRSPSLGSFSRRSWKPRGANRDQRACDWSHSCCVICLLVHRQKWLVRVFLSLPFNFCLLQPSLRSDFHYFSPRSSWMWIWLVLLLFTDWITL